MCTTRLRIVSQPMLSTNEYLRSFLSRWRLALQAVPLAPLAVLGRALFWSSDLTRGMRPLPLDGSVVGLAVSGAVFICTFLLNGSLQDYKEAEKLPSEVEAAFQNILISLLLGSHTKSDVDIRTALSNLRSCLAAFVTALDNSVTYATAAGLLRDADMALQRSVSFQASLVATTASNLSIIRAKQARIEIIARTSFPLPAYALLDSVSFCVVLLLILYSPASPLAGYVTTGFFAYVFSYVFSPLL